MKTRNYIYFKIKYRGKLLFPFNATICSGSKFEGANRIFHHSFFYGSMGYGSYIGHNCEIAAKIGRFTSIAPYVRTNRGIHPFQFPYVSTSPMFFSLQGQSGKTFAKEKLFEEFSLPIIIGNDCWICENVFISGGVKIGDGAVVLAGAVVTKDVPSYAIMGGVPAEIMGYRYEQETMDFLQRIQWWNNDIEWFREHWRLMNDMEKLKEYYKKEIFL